MSRVWVDSLCGSFPILGVPFWGHHKQDKHILGSILGSPDFGKLPCLVSILIQGREMRGVADFGLKESRLGLGLHS